MNRRQRITEIVTRRIEINTERAKLDAEDAALEAEFARLVPDDGPLLRGNSATDHVEQEKPGGSIASRIVAAIESSPARVFSLKDLGRLFPDVGPRTVRATSHRLMQEGKIERVDRGRYRAKKEARMASGP
jgi:hypothetical protein